MNVPVPFWSRTNLEMSVSPVSLGYKRKRGETPLRYPINYRGHHRGFVTSSNTHIHRGKRTRMRRRRVALKIKVCISCPYVVPFWAKDPRTSNTNVSSTLNTGKKPAIIFYYALRHHLQCIHIFTSYRRCRLNHFIVSTHAKKSL